MPTSSLRTKIIWDFGTAYDLFVSLHVLHNPDPFGLKPAWAAGVRSRLPSEHRKTLELAGNIMAMPHYFVHSLPKPKSSDVVIDYLTKTPAPLRLPKLFYHGSTPKAPWELLQATTANHKWTRTEKTSISEMLHATTNNSNAAILDQLHHAWSHREEFGEAYLAALVSYIENFFAEEELRILPVLKQGLSHAQMRSGSLPLAAMLEELSSGVRYRDLEHITHLYLAPSFWGAPYMGYEDLGDGAVGMLFASRPETMALIPGEIVPDTLINGLKALADPTRLRILRHLAQSSQTAAELSRALRLRPPTVAHHMMELRMAGLVQVIVDHEGDRQYATRFEGFDTIQELLDQFVHGD